MSVVVSLQPREPISCDMTRLQALGVGGAPGRWGARAQEDREALPPEIEKVLEDLAARLSCIAVSWRTGRFDALTEQARETGVLAQALGLDRMARVSRTVCVLCSGEDPAALAANLGRLMRLGENALAAIWDLTDASA